MLSCVLCSSFLKALLPQLPKCQRLLEAKTGSAGGSEAIIHRQQLLSLISALLQLSAAAMLNPRQPAFQFACNAYVQLLTPR